MPRSARDSAQEEFSSSVGPDHVQRLDECLQPQLVSLLIPWPEGFRSFLRHLQAATGNCHCNCCMKCTALLSEVWLACICLHLPAPASACFARCARVVLRTLSRTMPVSLPASVGAVGKKRLLACRPGLVFRATEKLMCLRRCSHRASFATR